MLECGSGLQAALSSMRLTILVRMVADYQIDLLDDDGHTVSTFITKRADGREALGLAQRMVGGRGQADVWAGARSLGQVSGASGTDVKVLGQLWASQPSKRA